jgi:hypothetical protein
MDVDLSVLYRGPLAFCNYRCGYCPFAKHAPSREAIVDDRQRLARFLHWVTDRPTNRMSVMFTPAGEALNLVHYQRAIVGLSRMEHVRRVAIQTNLSGPLDWLDDADPGRVGLWTTWHPTQIPLPQFLDKCHHLDAHRIRYSVGLVGVREHVDAIEVIRRALSPEIYVWVNAFKDVGHYYDTELYQRLSAVDPLFPFSLRPHPSLGRPCFAGESIIAVDGDGEMRRCPFLAQPIGNIYESNFGSALQLRACPKLQCNCHIGYMNLKDLEFREIFGEGLLERVPETSALLRLAPRFAPSLPSVEPRHEFRYTPFMAPR